MRKPKPGSRLSQISLRVLLGAGRKRFEQAVGDQAAVTHGITSQWATPGLQISCARPQMCANS